MGKPSAVPSLSWVTFGPKRANSTTVLGSSQYVKWVTESDGDSSEVQA